MTGPFQVTLAQNLMSADFKPVSIQINQIQSSMIDSSLNSFTTNATPTFYIGNSIEFQRQEYSQGKVLINSFQIKDQTKFLSSDQISSFNNFKDRTVQHFNSYDFNHKFRNTQQEFKSYNQNEFDRFSQDQFKSYNQCQLQTQESKTFQQNTFFQRNIPFQQNMDSWVRSNQSHKSVFNIQNPFYLVEKPLCSNQILISQQNTLNWSQQPDFSIKKQNQSHQWKLTDKPFTCSYQHQFIRNYSNESCLQQEKSTQIKSFDQFYGSKNLNKQCRNYSNQFFQSPYGNNYFNATKNQTFSLFPKNILKSEEFLVEVNQKMNNPKKSFAHKLSPKFLEDKLIDISEVMNEISKEQPPKQMILLGQRAVNLWKQIVNVLSKVISLKSIHDLISSLMGLFAVKKNKDQNGESLTLRKTSEIKCRAPDIILKVINVFTDLSQLMDQKPDDTSIDQIWNNPKVVFKLTKSLAFSMTKRLLKKRFHTMKPVNQMKIQSEIDQSLSLIESFVMVPLFNMIQSGDFDKLIESSTLSQVMDITKKYLPQILGGAFNVMKSALGRGHQLDSIVLGNLTKIFNLELLCQ